MHVVNVTAALRESTRVVRRTTQVLRRLQRAVNRLDARTVRWTRRTRATLLATAASAAVRGEVRLSRARADHVYLRDVVRRVNRARGIKTHRYRPVDVPVKYTWDAIRLAIQAEAMGSRRYVLGLTT